MRLLHVNAGNLHGGIETMLVTLARYRGEAPDLEQRFALCFPGRLAEELTVAGAPPEMLGPARASRPWTVWRARRALRALVAREKVDVVACHGSWSLGLFGRTARAAGARVVLWAHSPARGPGWLESLAGRVHPDLVIANSRFTADGVRHGFPGVAVEVLYPPVAAPPPSDRVERNRTRAGLGAAPEDVVILAASRLESLKGLHVLVEALGCLRDVPDWVCWISGGVQRGSERQYLAEVKEACRASGIATRVRFLGERRDVRTLMAGADVFCQANVEPDAFGMTFVEAMYAGLPVVTTALGGPLEVVDGNTGLAVDPNALAVSSALQTLVKDAALRARLGALGPVRATHLCNPGARARDLARSLSALPAPRDRASQRKSPEMAREELRNLLRLVVPRWIRNRLRTPRSTATWTLDWAMHRMGFRRRCAISADWTVECHPAAARAFRTHLRDDEFQRELAAFRAHGRSTMRLADVGAHYGIFTLAAIHYWPETRVIAVDPSPVAVRVLAANVALIGATDRVKIVRAALGAREETLRMLSTGPGSAHYMVFADSTRPDATRVAMTTLDALSRRLDGGPTHVKIDVEGFEEDVLRGGAGCLARLRPVVYLELHGAMIRARGGNPAAPLHVLTGLGYGRFESGGAAVPAAWAAERDLVRLVCLAS